MSKLNEFRDMVDGIKDKDVLESGRDLIRDMMEISRLKEEIRELEDGLTNGGRAMFYFFAMDLTEEEKKILQLIKKGESSLLVDLKTASGLSNKKWDVSIKGLTQKKLVKVVKNESGLFIEFFK